jgi:hypothetical protein
MDAFVCFTGDYLRACKACDERLILGLYVSIGEELDLETGNDQG